MTGTSTDIVIIGEPAPPFVLDAITRDGQVSLDDYRDRSGLFLNLVRGLHCPFCRRHLTQLASTESQLKGIGIDTLVVLSTSPTHAQKYLRYRPSPLTIASDPGTDVHRNYGLPRFQVSDDVDGWPRNLNAKSFGTPLPDPTGENREPATIPETIAKLNKKDEYEAVAGEAEPDVGAEGVMLEGRFLIDRHGIIRWVHVEARDGPQEFAKSPSPQDVMKAAHQMG